MTVTEHFRKNPHWRLLALVMIAGALLRGIYLVEISNDPGFTRPIYDPEYNAYWARGLATGDWTVPAGMTDPEIRTTPHGRPPGYPWFLAAVYTAFGVNDYAPRIAQMVVGLLNVLLMYLIGKRVFGPGVGLLAGLFMALYWVFPYFEGVLTYPAVAVFVLLLLLNALLRWYDAGGVKWMLATGACMGAFALFRPNGLLMAPGLLLWMVWVCRDRGAPWRRTAAAMAVFVLGCVAVLTPAFVRNYVVAGDNVFISSYGGINLYVGNHPEASLVEPRIPELMELAGIEHWSCFDYPAIVRGLAAAEGRESMTFSEANRWFYHRAFAFIRQDPGRFLYNMGRKTLLLFGPHEITNDTVMEYDKQFSRVLGFLPGFPWVLAFFIFGVVLFCAEVCAGLKQRDRRAFQWGVLLLLLVSLYSFSVIIYFVAGRYRVPIIPFMLVFGAYGLVRLWTFVRERRKVAAGAAVAGLVLLLPLAHWNCTGYTPSQGTWHLRRAMAYTARGEDVQARNQYMLALEHGAESSIIYANLGRLHFENGEVEQGLEMYWAGLQHNPNNAVIRNNLGFELYRLGEFDAAVEHLTHAVEINPRFALAHINLGNVLDRLGEDEEALAHFLEASRLNPSDPAGPYNAGRILFQQSEYAAAMAQYQQALAIDPEHVASLNNLGYCYAVQEDYEMAISFYERALAADPLFELAYINLSNAWLNLGEAEKAKDVFLALLRPDGPNTFTLYHLGRINVVTQHWDEAFTYLERALAANPDFVPALFQLGVLHYHQGDREKAVSLLEQALELEPDDRAIQVYLAEARAALDREPEVQEE